MSNFDKKRGSWAETIDTTSGDYIFPNGGFLMSSAAGDLELVYEGDEAAGRSPHIITVSLGDNVDFVKVKKILSANSTVTSVIAVHLAK